LYGSCQNTLGSYTCHCPPNYELSAEGNACIGKLTDLHMLERCSKTFTVFHWCSDTRRSECYMEVTFDTRGNPTCSHMSNKQLRHGACCCSVGKAWGPKCELCPQRGSPEYAALCPDRNGFTPNNITVSLSLLKKTKLRIHQNFCVQLSVDRTRFAPSSERKYATISNFVSFYSLF